ncbi:MAG: O-antigen ligase family protein [Candidatus Electrothrix sp. GW3-4]|uniref:O-antigen ligase family protein n=1 Tax=Candidatus Electrothrix sp. GW3-4 TaxID=3126740 RepID=UPI0030D32703
MSWLSLLSPARTSFLQSVNQLAETNIHYASLGYNPSSGILTVSFLIGLFLYAASLKKLLQSDRIFLRKILFTCIGVGILEAVYGLLQATNPHLGVLWLNDIRQFKGMARGTIIYKNQYAALLNMIWPLAVGAALLLFKAPPKKNKQKRNKRKSATSDVGTHRLRGFLFLFLASIIMLAVLFSQSRGGTLSMLLILSILLIGLPVSAKNKLLLSGFFILITLSYGSIIGFTSILDRFMLIQQGGETRFNIWLSSLPMLQDHQLVGTGIGSYILLSAIYLKQFPENIAFDRAHNDYLEFAIELGLPLSLFFLCALIIILFLQIKKIWPYTRKELSRLPSPAIVSLVSSAAIIGFLAHGIVDFGWRLPANLLYVTTLFILLQHGTRLSSHVVSSKPPPSRPGGRANKKRKMPGRLG